MEPQANKPARWQDLRTRAGSALALLAGAFAALWLGGVALAFLVILAAIIMVKEWEHLTENESPSWHIFGYPYIILPCATFLWIRSLGIPAPDHAQFGLVASFAFIFIITATDVGAYFTGRSLGRHLLAPSISPKKTWEGLGGGIIAAGLTGGLAGIAAGDAFIPHALGFMMSLGVVLALIAQAGDLFESYVKRRSGLKDSGSLIPGHGGLLDRLDGYLFAAPAYAFILYLKLHA
jgi:phosphatidate cytidylyltransferase